MSPKYLILASAAVLGSAWTGMRVSPAYVAKMTGSQETPPNSVLATGAANFNVIDNKLHFVVRVNGLSGAPTAAHIHVGAAGVAGPPVYTFVLKSGAGQNGAISEGMFDLTTAASTGVSGDSLRALLGNGKAYVNIHTAAHPGGEVRGQVMPKR